ncbi:hypothetical protein BBI09_06790 [Stutzerimonas xanthomarina]|uniref:hypothetical protein n=1 Tax=Stutzerimonas nitrititolerans TaxID=2482751 RepID=UPI000826A391|nr:hypothetical protein [Stutzerimonas nitrititolerans]OCX20077.1 hypothetical protein BBI09_06790 [Stutzerimonas xanthomarina]
MVTEKIVKDATGSDFSEFSVDGIGIATSSSFPKILTFMDDKKFLSEINGNKNIRAVFVRPEDVTSLREGVRALEVDDPKWYFFTVLNYLAVTKARSKSVIAKTAEIHPTAVISETGVIIEDDVIIEPNVTVLKDVIIRSGAVIRAGAVLGVDGYEHKRTSRGILTVAHDGKVVIGKCAEIGVNTNVVKGFSYRDTIVGDETKIDALVHYAHGAQCGSRCMIVASAMVAGHVTMGDDVWIGPNASISNRTTIGDGAFVTLGSVVVQDVPANTKVTGNFAIPHMKFIRNLKLSTK